MRGRTVRNPVLLRKAQDRGHAASHLASGDLPAQEIGQLLVQGNRRVVVEHVPELTSPVSTHARWGLPVCTREYTCNMTEAVHQQAVGCQVRGGFAAQLDCPDVIGGDDALQMPTPDVVRRPVTETETADRRRALLREAALRALI